MINGTEPEVVASELKKFGSTIQSHIQGISNFKEEACDKLSLTLNGPIAFNLSSFEQIESTSLIHTNNEYLDKTIKVLYIICKEAAFLVEEAELKLYSPILLYSQKVNENITNEESLSKFLPVLEDLLSFIDQLELLAINFVLQINALHPEEKKPTCTNAGTSHFQVIFEHLGQLLSTLINIDEIIFQDLKLKSDVKSYANLIKSVKNDTNSKWNDEDLTNLESIIKDIESILNKSLLQSSITNICEKCKSTLEKNKNAQIEFQAVLLGWSSKVENVSVENSCEDLNSNMTAITALALLYHSIFENHDRKVSKQLVSLFKKVPCCTTFAGNVWMGEVYIKNHFSSFYLLFDNKSLQSIISYRRDFMATQTTNLSSDVQAITYKFNEWALQMNAAALSPTNKLGVEELNKLIEMIYQGLCIGNHARNVALSLVGLHTVFGRPISRASVIGICHLVEIMKSIKEVYEEVVAQMFVEIFSKFRQILSYKVLRILADFKKFAAVDKKNNLHQLDVVTAISIAEEALSSSASSSRRLLARISLSLLVQHNLFQADQVNRLVLIMKRLELIEELLPKLKKATDTKFLLKHQVVTDYYLQEVFRLNPNTSHRIPLIFAAIGDTDEVLKDTQNILTKYESLEKNFKKECLDKLCETFETELRLNTHKHLELDGRNPYEKPLKIVAPLIAMPTLKIGDKNYSVKEYLEKYLARTFYSLTVLAPHNSCVYQQMIDFARQNFGINTLESSLPPQNLQQGVDVLEIMRNIDSFVSHYQYNMNQQFFVESTESDNKYLNTVSLKHISNSIRTHGTGIINTTVNYTYQYLRKKFHILSQFLYDEHIKSRLLKDLQYWKELKSKNEELFPYERAEKFHKGIRKLGVSSKGLTYLDQFRKLITDVGNAIGFVRLVRSGGLHRVSSIAQFLPKFETIPTFQDVCSSQNETTMKAAEIFDQVNLNVTSFFDLETDYLKIMVDAFSVLRDDKNAHLRNFFLIVPALTINYVEYLMAVKGNKGTVFTQDGFAIGLSYILNVLDQETDYSSLHWRNGVRNKLNREKKKIETEMRGRGDEKLHQPLTLGISRLDQQLSEFELLFFTLHSARVFFKGNKVS